MGTETGDFAVLLTQPERHDVMGLARALAAFRKTPEQDQIIKARRAWGIIAENISEDAAKALVTGLQSSFPCVAVLMASLTALPPVTPLTQLEAGLSDGCILIAAAAITLTTTTTRTIKEGPSATQKVLSAGILLTTGLPIKIGPKKRTIEKKQESSELLFYLDLFYANPLRRRRIDAQKFDYSGLKERKLYNLMGNFKLVVSDLVQATPNAWRNHGTRVLLSNQPIRTMEYADLANLERESRWLLTLQSLGK